MYAVWLAINKTFRKTRACVELPSPRPVNAPLRWPPSRGSRFPLRKGASSPRLAPALPAAQGPSARGRRVPTGALPPARCNAAAHAGEEAARRRHRCNVARCPARHQRTRSLSHRPQSASPAPRAAQGGKGRGPGADDPAGLTRAQGRRPRPGRSARRAGAAAKRHKQRRGEGGVRGRAQGTEIAFVGLWMDVRHSEQRRGI